MAIHCLAGQGADRLDRFEGMAIFERHPAELADHEHAIPVAQFDRIALRIGGVASHPVEHGGHAVQGAVPGQPLGAQAERGIVENGRDMGQGEVARRTESRVDQRSSRFHGEELAVDRIAAGQQRKLVIEKILLDPRLEDAGLRRRDLDVAHPP